MDAKRAIRRWFTERLSGASVRAAPWLPVFAIDLLEFTVAHTGPWMPVLGRTVADNMRSAGLYSHEAHREYFARVAQHLAGLMHVFRQQPTDDGQMSAGLARLVTERVQLDDSVERLQSAHALGRGVVLTGAHPANFMLALARLNQELPVTVYLRHSKSASKQASKQRCCAALGLQYIAEPPSATNPVKRAELMADALRAGRILVITPDLVQHRDEGVPVQFLGREVYLPGGPVAIALLVEAPLITVLARPAGADAISLAFFGPAPAFEVPRAKGWRQEATRHGLQWFADLMVEEFLRPSPGLWFLWGDKRWTRVFRGDSRYTRPLVAQEGTGL